MSSSDNQFALTYIRKAHDSILKVLDIPEIQKQLEPEQREGLQVAERMLMSMRAQFAEAVGHELAQRQL